MVDYQEQALACNRRYLDALAVVDDPAPAYQQLRQLTEPKVVGGRSYAGFNPARREDVRLFKAVLDGRPHRAWLSQRRYPATALRRPEAISPPTTCQCRGRATAQAVARAPIGGKGPAHTMLASDGTRPKPPRLGCTALSLILATTGGLARCYRAENFSASCREVQRKESIWRRNDPARVAWRAR